MAVTILLCDLRNQQTLYARHDITWKSGLNAFDVVVSAFGMDFAKQLANDLIDLTIQVTVSFVEIPTGQTSDVTGVASLDWELLDPTIIVINYEDNNTTDSQIDESIQWLLNNSDYEI